MSSLSPSPSPTKKNLNGTTSFSPDTNTTALLCQNNHASYKAECLRHILCLPPLQPTNPSHVKAYESHSFFDDAKNGTENRKVVESQMWMADALLDVVHKATCSSVSTQYHHEWHKVHHTHDAKFQDEIVPYDNIVTPPKTTLFPDIDNEIVGGSPSRDTASGNSVMMLRHAAEIAPSAGHVEGDYSINTHDKSIHTTEEKDSSSPQRLRITSKAVSPEANVSSPSRTRQIIEEQEKDRIQAQGEEHKRIREMKQEEGFEQDYSTLVDRDVLLVDADKRREIREEEERKKQEEEAKKQRIQIFKWRLNIFCASDDSDAIAFAANPLSATAIHRCSVQILAMHNNPEIPSGSTVLSNGVFERPGSIFGICHKSALKKENSNRPELWNGLSWKCDNKSTLPAAALMVAKSASGKPIAELPNSGKRSENTEHYVRVGDILTVETRPGGQKNANYSKGTGFFDAIFNGNKNSNSSESSNTSETVQPVSCHFFINNVEVFSWSNIALLQPYCKAKNLSDDSDVTRSEYGMDFMYFGVRLWKGTEVAIVSGDPSRIVSSEMI